MPCMETGDCAQGRARCKTPLTCSGLDVDEAIEMFQRERLPRSFPAKPWPSTEGTLDEEIGLPVAVAAVVACICVAALICAAVGLHAAGQYLGLF